jgi:hypothetical protein
MSLDAAGIELITTGDATGTVSVTDGTTSTPTETITGISGDGTIGIGIKPGTALNIQGLSVSSSGPSTTFDVDNTVPVITLTGDNPQEVEVGDAYTELGATASDNYDGDISGSIVIDASAVNTSVVASYKVTYNVTDANSNAAAQVTRTVNVMDTIPMPEVYVDFSSGAAEMVLLSPHTTWSTMVLSVYSRTVSSASLRGRVQGATDDCNNA